MKNWILMGDVINSRKNDQLILQKEFAKLIDMVNSRLSPCLYSPLTITLGDEFQGIPKSSAFACELILGLEEFKWQLELEIQLRYSLVLGEIETPINTKIAYGMLGSGLVEAREILQSLKQLENRFVLGGSLTRKEEMNLAMNLVLEKQSEWKWSDKDLIESYFLHQEYKKVAEHLQKDISLIWRRFKSMGFKSYQNRRKLTQLIYGSHN